jgi:hypothetical protein
MSRRTLKLNRRALNLHKLNYYLDQRNKDVVNKLKAKLVLFLNKHEEEFFDAILGEYREPFIKVSPLLQELSYAASNCTNIIMYLFYTPDTRIHIHYSPKNFFIPYTVLAIKHERLSKFSKYLDLKTQCETINYFAPRLQELKDFISLYLKDKNYTLLQLLRTYPELYNYLNKHFLFKTPPLRKNAKKLPEHLAEYIRKIEFMS